ncbi:MAG: GNAT family N-acetyltransferase [Promethearchaeota archaeon]
MEESYQLSDEFRLKRCNPEKYATNWAIFSSFSTWDDFKSRKKIILDSKERVKDNCYRIIMQNRPIGGLILKPNEIGYLFFEPPFLNYYGVIQLLVKLLRKLSDDKKTTYVYCITSEFVDDFLRCGLYPNETRRRMARATEKFDIEWEDDLVLKVPEKQDIEEMVKIYLKAYSGSREEWLRSQERPGAEKKDPNKIKKDFEDLLTSGEEQKEEKTEYPFVPGASTAIFSKHNKKQQMIGCCLVSLWNTNDPIIYDIFIAPEYQGKGLGTKMLQHALTNLANDYEYLQLFVIKGNKAESVYHNLGFKSLEEIPMLIIPTKNAKEE